MRVAILCGVFFSGGAFLGTTGARAQTLPQPPPPPEDPAPDPYHAAKSVEIGQFYMKKGKYEAAIDRFRDAIRLQPKLALPRRLLGEAYEKQKDNSAAVEWYRKYLEVFPQAEDATAIRRRIEILQKEIERQETRRKKRSATQERGP